MNDTYYNQRTVISSNGLFTSQVFGWMTLGVIITALIAAFISFLASQSEQFLVLVAVLSFPAIIIQLILVLVLSFAWRKLNGITATILFLAYSAFTGITVGVIALSYSVGSLFLAFGISALMFLILAAYGLITKRDLSKWRAVGLFALVGIILVTFINIILLLLNSPLFNTLSALLNYAIVIVFSILIASDANQLNALANEADNNGQSYTKYAISGALMLYLDFINLFLSVLRITGSKRN